MVKIHVTSTYNTDDTGFPALYMIRSYDHFLISSLRVIHNVCWVQCCLDSGVLLLIALLWWMADATAHVRTEIEKQGHASSKPIAIQLDTFMPILQPYRVHHTPTLRVVTLPIILPAQSHSIPYMYGARYTMPIHPYTVL